jgi:hypothetical protein
MAKFEQSSHLAACRLALVTSVRPYLAINVKSVSFPTELSPDTVKDAAYMGPSTVRQATSARRWV